MTKIHISYRNAKGHMQSADPFNCPPDAPEAIKQASAAIVAYTEYGPPVPADYDWSNPPVVVRKRGRPMGYRCSLETVARMTQARRAMWNEIKSHMADVNPER